MYIVNGTANTVVWARSVVGFTVGRNYRIRAYAASAHYDNPAQLRFSIPGGPVGGTSQLTAIGVWLPVELTFTALSTQVYLELRDVLSTLQGNDFVIDDIEVIDVLTNSRVLKEDFEVFSNYQYRDPGLDPNKPFPDNHPLWDQGVTPWQQPLGRFIHCSLILGTILRAAPK